MVLLRSIGTLKGGNRVMGIDSNCTHGTVLPGGLKMRTAAGGLGSLGLRGRRTSGITTRGLRRTGRLTRRVKAGGIIMGVGSNRNKHVFNSISAGRVTRTTGRRTKLSLSGGGVRLNRSVGTLKACRVPIGLRPGMATALHIRIIRR